MTAKARTRRTFPVVVTRVAPKPITRTAAQRRAQNFYPPEQAFTTSSRKS
jgi:hypothetical protein